MAIALQANALIDADLAKLHTKLISADYTDLINFWINSASDYLESECDRKFKRADYTELSHGRNSNLILLEHFPVTAIIEVSIDQESDFTDPAKILEADEYRIADDGNSILLLNRSFPKGYNNVRIEYTAGYGPGLVPSDLQMACVWLVSWYQQLRDGKDIGRPRRGKGEESIEVNQSAPQHVKDCIARYKRTEFPSLAAPIRNV